MRWVRFLFLSRYSISKVLTRNLIPNRLIHLRVQVDIICDLVVPGSIIDPLLLQISPWEDVMNISSNQ